MIQHLWGKKETDFEEELNKIPVFILLVFDFDVSHDGLFCNILLLAYIREGNYFYIN